MTPHQLRELYFKRNPHGVVFQVGEIHHFGVLFADLQVNKHQLGWELSGVKLCQDDRTESEIFSEDGEYLGFPCSCCGLPWRAQDNDDYMLVDSLWNSLVKDSRQILHWNCAEKINGKPFTKYDMKLCLCTKNIEMLELSREQHKENHANCFPHHGDWFDLMWEMKKYKDKAEV